ncbi:hypothetical protein LLEC1_00550 [Akanthomyces lecanii]|uniref:Uncharacterized protein n=1 Tax=Cordyceps confragosa TaxID=2714763 RepID=A0A179I789_CORDF|nr:hypothetical protein LLEC1_00550 [Akanthomyces lecanii]
MHFTAPLVLITAVTGAHAFVIQRDAKPILDVFAKVQTDIDGLDSAVKGWTTDPAPVLDASNKLVTTIGDGANAVQGTGDLTLNEAISLLGPVKDLKGHAQTLVNDLKGKKDVVQKAGLCDAVSSQVTDISGKSKSLIDATVSKVPAAAQKIAQQQAQGILDILKDAQTAFSADNCKNA